MITPSNPTGRRNFLATAAGALSAATISSTAQEGAAAAPATAKGIVLPPAGKRVLLSVKLGMIASKRDGKDIPISDRLKMAAEAGFDGVDFDEAGSFTPEQARDAVRESGVFVHNAINHAHWSVRLTDPKPEVRAKAVANLEHCVHVSHSAGGSAVLLVVGQGGDGETAEIEERCRAEIKKVLPLAASLGQRILFENVWNRMMYDHDKGPEQGPERFIQFVDSFQSPWIGMYFDLGNHWKYGQPGEWLKQFGTRAVKLDVKGFSRAKGKFVDITSEDDDLPWDQVRKAIADTGWTGWTTAEVGGGEVPRLKIVREQMQKAFGL